jgi:hypothetical protein
MRRTLACLAVAAVFLCSASSLSAQTLAWDANTEPDVAGYILHYGTQSGVYTANVNVGNQTTFRPNVDWNKPWFFAVQAYTTSGLTSALSAEAQWTPVAQPPGGATLNGLTASAGNPLLVGQPVTWTVTGSSTRGAVEYRYWLYSAQGGWKSVQEYGPNNTFTWTPTYTDQGTHYLQVWARTVGTTAPYEAWQGTGAFDVMSVPMELKADVDFPTPPGNPVTWTARVAGSETTPLEYKFWAFDPVTSKWAMLRDYAPSNTAVWVPAGAGKYAIQAWARRQGSSVNYESWIGSGLIDVMAAPLQITRLDADTNFPAVTGTPITWTARVKGGTTGPLQYQFWLYSSKGWAVAQPWSPLKTFTWTPSWTDAGQHAVQVWVRNAGSTAQYDAWKGTGVFDIQMAPLHLASDKVFPIAPGTTVKWTASVVDPTTFQYQFWVYKQGSGTWSLAQPYGAANTFNWTPATGTYAVQAWARRVGSTSAYDAWRGTDWLGVAMLPIKFHSLLADTRLPSRTGTAITWTAMASGGSAGPLQYQFWRFDTATGWQMVQGWSTSNTYTWTPGAGEAGTHAIQAWVRSAGSTALYEAYLGTGYFTIAQ